LKGLLIIFTFFIQLWAFNASGQTKYNVCDSIYHFAEKMPHFIDEERGLMHYMNEEIFSILSDCYSRDSILTTSMNLTLTIDNVGQVIDVKFNRIQASESCKKEIRNKMLDMKGWTAGNQDGVPVCCEYILPIGCIYWK
jgi:hypothetical protein